LCDHRWRTIPEKQKTSLCDAIPEGLFGKGGFFVDLDILIDIEKLFLAGSV